MSEYAEPSPQQRAQRYLALAEVADEKAFSTTGTIRDNYRCLAEQWRKLAHFAEEAGKVPNDPAVLGLVALPTGDRGLSHQ
jgi:hypothetical protein